MSSILLVLACYLVTTSLLGLSSRSTFYGPGFFVHRPRQNKMVSSEFDLFQDFFCSILADCWGIYSQWTSLVSCRRQQMLTQGATADSKCKLYISSFLIYPHQLDCLICAKNIMVIVMLLEMKGESAGGVGRLGVVHL